MNGDMNTKEGASKVRPLGDDCGRKHGDRGTWSNQVDFFLSCLGFAVGLGNVWRFPYLCYKNGGGAFLIPYLVTLVFCGLPLFYLELSLGQYSGVGPNIVFKRLGPIFRGIGFGMVMVSLLVVLYYNVIIAWTLFYTFASFTSKLGWESCGNEWNTPVCFDRDQNSKCLEKNLTFWNGTCYDPARFCNSIPGLRGGNTTHCLNVTGDVNTTASFVRILKAVKRIDPSEEYNTHYVLGKSASIDDFGEIRWQLALCLLLAWLMVGACLIKGVKSSGKVVYFTALFPYVVLFILLIRGVLLKGASDGIYYYVVPEWEKLKSPQVWADAATQIFYSLGIGFGGLHTLSSYNSYRNNCYRDAIVIAITNCATSVFAGFAIFSILGFMADSLELPIEEVVKSGESLAFIAYPEVVTRLPVSPLWSFLFFFMLITLGLDSQFTMCETIITAVLDERPSFRKYKSTVVVVVCAVLFLLGLPMCAEGGYYLFTLINNYSASASLIIITIAECLVIGWAYGIRRYSENIEEMLGRQPNIYWKLCWSIISPLVMLAILVASIVYYEPPKDGDNVYPSWAIGLGWAICCSSVVLIPIFAVYEIFKANKKGKPLKSLFKPTPEWETQNIHEEKASQMKVVAPVIGRERYSLRETYDNPSFNYSTGKEKEERF